MTEQVFGAVAALKFRVSPKQGFEDIVEEFDIAFRPIGMTRRGLIWDGEDIAMIDRDSIRIILGWLDHDAPSELPFLIIAVGKNPEGQGVDVNAQTCLALKQMVIEHVQSYLPVCDVYHADVTEPMQADLIDTISALLQRENWAGTPRGMHSRPARAPDENRADPFQAAGNARQAFRQSWRREDHVPDDASLGQMDIAQISLPQRLTIYALGATMLIYTPPVGATLLVYSALRDFASKEPAETHRLAA